MRKKNPIPRGTRGSAPGRLRIVAGKWRSRLLPIPDETDLRPTSARIRETLFNWLGDELCNARCLDLYAGSGALGFEALSRGASALTAVDQSREVCRQLKENVRTLDATGTTIVRQDVTGYLSKNCGDPFDVVFIDPPFDSADYEQVCLQLTENRWLTRGALVYIEQARKAPTLSLPAGWSQHKAGCSGNVRYELYVVA